MIFMFSMSAEQWQKQKQGVGCPFCLPRQDDNKFWLKVASLSISTLYLNRIQTYRGYSVLVYDPCHATIPSQLSSEEWVSFCKDLHLAQAAIERVTRPDHMNVAALGNQIAHLHWHIIPRYQNDSRWGGPIWTTKEEEMEILTLQDLEHRKLAEAIRAEII
jgi:diadenosine tetraphosphate (Ap4A) HIT family hydrolase